MEAKRIFITGANGFVGRHLIAHLLKAHGGDVSVIASVRPDEVDQPGIAPETAGWTGRESDQVSVVGLALEDPEQVSQVLCRAEPDWIVHLAARASGADADRDAVTSVNVGGTRNVLEAAASLTPFPRALVVSTGYVYGNTDPSRPAREEDPIGPLWRFGPYTDSKIEMESVARSYRAFTIIARPFTHTGPGQTPTFVTPTFARQLARMEQGLEPPVLKVGNLSALRDLLDVRDVVRAYDSLLRDGQPGEAYNVSTGRPVAIETVLQHLRSFCSIPTTVEVDPLRLRPADIVCSSGDPIRLSAATGWAPTISLETTLRDVLDYWRVDTGSRH